MFDGGQPRVAKQLTALFALPVAAVLMLSACSDATNSAADVTLTPIAQESGGSADNHPFEGVENYTDGDVEVFEVPGHGEDAEATFVREDPGLESTITLTAEGGLVTEQTTTNVFDYAGMGWGSKDEAKTVLDATSEQMQGVAGVEQSVEYGETSATEELVIDMDTVDLTETTDMPGSHSETGVSEDSVIGFEQTRQMILQMGYVEVE